MLSTDLYVGESFISHGTVGITLKACKVGEAQEIAVKVISLTNVENDAKTNLIKTIRSLKGISHRNILQYTNIYASNRSIFIEMMLMKEKSLSSYLLTHRRHGNIPELVIQDIIYQIASGLDYLHQGGNVQIVHGNLTPRNVFYDSGILKIADYGIYAPFFSAQPLNCVTSRYTSPPEFSEGQCNSPEKIVSIYTDKTDIWMLGNLIMELCTYHINTIDTIDVSACLSSYSSIIKDIVSDCLHKDPSKRPSAADIITRVRRPETGVSNMTSLRTNSFLNLGTSVQMSQVLSKEISLCRGLLKDTGSSKDINHKSYTSRLSGSIYCNYELIITKQARLQYHEAFLINTPSPAVSIMVARHVQTDALVYLEVLNVKQVSTHILQRYKHDISQIRNNPCINIITINYFEQIEDLYICEMEYSDAPTLQSIVNEYFRAGSAVPEELIWDVLLGISTGLLHLRSIGILYGLLSPVNILIHDCTIVISNIACSYLVHKVDKSTSLKIPLHGLIELVLWITNSNTMEKLLENNLKSTFKAKYSHDLVDIIKQIDMLSRTESLVSPVEYLTNIRNIALEHVQKYSIRPFSLGAPKQLLALADSDNMEELKRYITRFNSCPPGALLSAINKQRLESIATMCREISRCSLSTRIPLRSGIHVREPTPLMIAVWQDDLSSISQNKEYLMARYNGITSLMISAYKGRYKCLTNLLSELGIQNWSGTTALMFAADRGHEDCTRLLLAEMGIQRHDGMSALMFAIQAGHIKLVELLQQEKGLRNSHGLTAYDIAVDKGLDDCIKLLSPHELTEPVDTDSTRARQIKTDYPIIHINSRSMLPPGKFSNLMLAASSNDITSIRKYLNEEARRTTIEGKTALMFAAELGNTAAVQKLAKVEAKTLTITGDAAIFMAIRNNNHECVAILRRYEKDLTNELGETPIQFAERLGHNLCVTSLTNSTPSPHYSLNQYTNFTESGDRLLPINQASMINTSLKPSKAQSKTANNSSSQRINFPDTQTCENSIDSYNINHGSAQDVSESCISQIDKDDKSINKTREEKVLEQSDVGYGGTLESSIKTESITYAEDTDTGAVDGTELLVSKRYSSHTSINQSNNSDNVEISCSSIVQTGIAVEGENTHKLKERFSNKKEKDRGKRQNKDTNISKSGKAYLTNTDADSTLSSESTLANEDVSRNIDMELVRDIDFSALSRNIASLEMSRRRKSKKPRASKIKTKLILAVEQNNLESFKSHLKDDAAKSYNGLTALMIATMANNLPFICILSYYESTLGKPDGTTALMIASEKGLTEAVSILIEKEAGILDKRGNTALLRLLESPPPHTCISLLAKAEGKIARKDGQTPLMIALEKGIPQDITELTLFGAGQTNKEGQTALMIAAAIGLSDCIEKLIPSESRMSDKKGMTALMYAAAAGNIDCIKLLINYEKGMQTKQKQTALHYAVENNRIECVKLLLFVEEDVPNAKGQRCLAIAKMKHFHECARLLSQEVI